jgi:amino acid transporter
LVIAASLSAIISASDYGGASAMIIATAAMMCVALSFQRLNVWEQNAGGPYSWVARALNPYVGVMVGWLMLVAYVLTIILTVIALGPSFLGVLGVDTSNTAGTIIIVLVVGGLLVLVAACGIELSARLQIIVAAVEFLILGVFTVIAFLFVFVAKSPGTVQPTVEWLIPSGFGGGSLVAGVLVAVYFLSAWDVNIYLSEETDHPQKNPGKAALIAVAGLGVVYTLFIVAFQGVAPASDIEQHSENSLAYLAGVMTGTLGGQIASIAVALSVVATVQAGFVATSRIVFSMSRDLVLPSGLARISTRYKTPLNATVLLGIIGIGGAIAYVLVSSVAGAIDALIGIIGLLFVTFYAITGFVAPWYYRRQLFKSAKDLLLSGVIPVLGAGLLAWVGVQTAAELERGPLVALVMVLIFGFVLLIAVRLIRKPPIFDDPVQRA